MALSVESPVTNGATNGKTDGTTNGTTKDRTIVENTSNGKHTALVDPSIMLHANDLAAVPELLQSVTAQGAALAASRAASNETRSSLLETAKALVVALETPRETMLRQTWAEHGLFAIFKYGIDSGLWAHLGADDKPKHVSELAAATGINGHFLARSLKHVAAMGYITETGRDEYRGSNLVRALTVPIMAGGYRCFVGPGATGGLTKAMNALPGWLAENAYKSPHESNGVGPLQYAFDTNYNMFEWLHANAPAGHDFNLHMGGYGNGRPLWFHKGFYPVQGRLLEGFNDSDESALLVDIGGGLGHDLERFRASFPDAPGRLVLQDLDRLIDEAPAKDDGIERVVYNFYHEQPVKGARAYYFHSILHDWSDEQCLAILDRVKAAMKPGYSRLLLNENVVPDTGAHWEITAVDMVLACCLSARERTRVEWMQLLDKAGLVVDNIYHFANNPRSGVESVIECQLRV